MISSINLNDIKTKNVNIETDTFSDANVSIFNSPNPNLESKKTDNNSNIDGIIGKTKQGILGDCWILSSINSLASTSWGRKAIKEAIWSDGYGGAIVRLNIPYEKTFHISAKVLKENEGIYSVGDDDMTSYECAIDRFYRNNIGYDINNGGSVTDFVNIIKLICGMFATSHNFKNGEDDITEALEEFEKRPNQYVAVLGFKENDKNLHTQHAYQLKSIKTIHGEKYAVLINPWDSEKENLVPLETVKKYYQDLAIIEPNDSNNPKIQTNIDNIRNKILDSETKKELTSNIKVLNSENVFKILDHQTLVSLIKKMDSMAWGWGNGKEKKELIKPIIDIICDYALKKGISKDLIEKNRSVCYKELDAWFYTNHWKIINKLYELR